MVRSLGLFLFASILFGQGPAPLAQITIDGGRGEVPVFIPGDLDPNEPTPVVMLLHGYTGTGAETEEIIQFTPLAEEYGFIYLYPDGTLDQLSNRFWNGTDACCDLFDAGIDDVTYLTGLIDILAQNYSVNPYRVYLIGHSNGGFMSYRLACDRAERFAAVVSMAGATFFNVLDCNPSEPVHILQIHGTSDSTIGYTGGTILNSTGFIPYPGALQTVETWAGYNGCLLTPDESQPDIDIEADLPGAETSIADYVTDCQPGGTVSLWTMADGVHIPNFQADAPRRIVEYLYAHPKPQALCREPVWTLATVWPQYDAGVDHNGDGRIDILDGVVLATDVCVGE